MYKPTKEDIEAVIQIRRRMRESLVARKKVIKSLRAMGILYIDSVGMIVRS